MVVKALWWEKLMGKPFHTLVPKRYRCDEPGYHSYLRMINKPQGVIKDQTMVNILGGKYDDATMSQSQYRVEALFDGLEVYDRVRTWQPNRKLLSQSFNAVERRFAALNNTLHPMDAVEVQHFVSRSTSAGAPYFKKKKEVFDSGYRFDKRRVGVDPCVAYYRTQSRQKTDGSFSPKVRLVWGFPLDQTIAEGAYARPAIEAIMCVKNPYVLGLGKSHIAARLCSFQWAPMVGSFDWSKFDATVPKQLISLAFNLVKKWFVKSSIDETLWTQIVEYFIYTPILMPDGKVYYGKAGGIPSGSYFTGVIGSLCNLLLIEYLIRDQDRRIREVLVMGDDSVVALDQELDVKKMAKIAHLHFGMELHPDKQRYTRYDHDMSFLSHTWKHGRPTRPVEVSEAKAVYSERSWPMGVNAREFRLEKSLNLYADNPDFWPLVKDWFRQEGVVDIWGPRTGGIITSSFTDKTTEVYGRKARAVPIAVSTFL